MQKRLSRRDLANYVADQIIDGNKKIMDELAAYLLESNRTNEVDLIVKDIYVILEQKGYLYAQVQSAHKLDNSEIDEIAKYLKAKTGAKKIEIEESVDKDLIGGLRVETPTSVFDNTILANLNALKALKK